VFVGFPDQVRRKVQCEGKINIVTRAEQAEGWADVSVFWVGEYWELDEFEAIRLAFNRTVRKCHMFHLS